MYITYCFNIFNGFLSRGFYAVRISSGSAEANHKGEGVETSEVLGAEYSQKGHGKSPAASPGGQNPLQLYKFDNVKNPESAFSPMLFGLLILPWPFYHEYRLMMQCLSAKILMVIVCRLSIMVLKINTNWRNEFSGWLQVLMQVFFVCRFIN